MLTLRETIYADAVTLARDVREADKEEWHVASFGKPLIVNLEEAINEARRIMKPGRRDSKLAFPLSLIHSIIDEDGDCLAMFGCLPLSVQGNKWGDDGNAWMICTNTAVRRVHEMHRFFHSGIDRMHAIFPELIAWAYEKNTVHHEWMEHFGWKRSGKSFSISGSEFYGFVRRVPWVIECVSP